jgi:hypothetical protein
MKPTASFIWLECLSGWYDPVTHTLFSCEPLRYRTTYSKGAPLDSTDMSLGVVPIKCTNTVWSTLTALLPLTDFAIGDLPY